MARSDEISSNEALTVLEDWNTFLEHHVPYFREPKP